MHFKVSYEFGKKTLFQLQQGSIYGEIFIFLTKKLPFLGFKCMFEQIKTKRKIYKQSRTKHFLTFQYLAQIFYTTIETQLDFYHQKLSVRVAS